MVTLSRDKIQAISHLEVWGMLTKSDCGRHTWGWLKKHSIGDITPRGVLLPNDKAFGIYRELQGIGAFRLDPKDKRNYCPIVGFAFYETRRAMAIEG